MECSEPITPKFLLFNNVYLHSLILFLIIAALFKYVIIPLSEHHINAEFIEVVNNLVDPERLKKIVAMKNDPTKLREEIANLANIDQTDPQQVILLESIVSYIQKTPNETIAKNFQDIADTLASNPTPLREKNNKGLFSKLGNVLFLLIVIAVIINTFPRIFGGKCTGIKHLAKELLAIFIGVGIVEVWFFMNIGSKYVPVMPSVITVSFQEHVNSLVNKPKPPPFDGFKG